MSARAASTISSTGIFAWSVALLALEPVSAAEGRFVGPSPVLLDAPPSSILLADLNQDGILDLVVTHASRSVISVLHGSRNSSPGSPESLRVGLGPRQAAVADVNADGFEDILVLNGVASSLSTLLGKADGGFESKDPVNLDPQPDRLTAVDVDSDGDIDLLVTSSRPGQGALPLLGDGKGAFARLEPVAVSGLILELDPGATDAGVPAEVDAYHGNAVDGAEILVTTLEWSGGDLKHGAERRAALPARPRSVAARTTQPGNAPVAIVLAGAEILALETLGGGALGATPLGPAFDVDSTLRTIEIVDATGDGQPDVALLLERAGVSYLHVLEGKDNGAFGPGRDVNLGLSGVTLLSLGDVDGDGIRDAILGRDGSRTLVLARGADRELELSRLQPLGIAVEDIIVTDQDADGSPDLVVRSGRTLQVLPGDGQGGIGAPVAAELPELPTPLIPLAYGDMAALDYDLDGALDLGFSASGPHPTLDVGPGAVVVAFLDRAGLIQETFQFRISERPGAIASGDWNRDGFGDLVVADRRSNAINFLWGASTRFGPSTDLDVGAPQVGVVSGDVDGDGALDLALAMEDSVEVLLGDGTGEFPRMEVIAQLPQALALRLLDTDGDGKLEILLASSAEIVLVRNPLSGGQDREVFDGVPDLHAFEVAGPDMNGDVHGLWIHGVPRTLGVGRLHPRSREDVPLELAVGAEPRAIAVADLDRDGVTDCIVADSSSKGLVLLRGRSSPRDSDFRRGDADGSGAVSLTDAVFTLNYLFAGGPEPPCEDAVDANDNGSLELTDAVWTLGYLFLGKAPPALPGPDACGPDPSQDPLDACTSLPCR